MSHVVTVLGAGPAGAMAACLLARAGVRVQLVDPHCGGQRDRVGESLIGAARPLLRSVGLEGVLDASVHLPSPGICSSWGTDALVETDFVRDPHGGVLHLDRRRFDESMREEAIRSGVEFNPAEACSPAWVIDCSGRSSSYARSRGAERLRDGDLTALYAWTCADVGDGTEGGARGDARTRIEAVVDGWWYASPLPDGRKLVAFHSTSGRARELLREPGAWEQALSETRHIREWVGSGFEAAPRGTEACGSMLDRVWGLGEGELPGWIAAGDAAMAFDPLSSQGLYNALYTGLKAARAVLAALGAGASLAAQGAPGAPAYPGPSATQCAAMEEYAWRLGEIRRIYLARRREYYAQEHRWAREPFWQARV